MSGLAKVFLVINLVLAIVFLGSSAVLFSVRKDFKKEMADIQSEYSKKFQEQADALATLEQKVKTQDLHLSVQLAEITNKDELNKELSRDLSRVKTDLKSANESVSTKDTKLETLNAQLSDLTSNVDNLNKRLETANQQRESALAIASAKTGEAKQNILEKTQLEEDLAVLNAEVNKLRVENGDMATKIKLLEKGLDPSAGPDIAAKVMEVSQDFVMISMGKDDNVVEGMKLMVSRAGNYLGDIKILKVYRDFAGAQITYRKDNAEIKEGDDVNTKRI